ncbi:DUF1918 domain-containing protein [Microbispora hainanensis]|jgi:hypothetical protein|uniref:DUF1918 domain-containing protein n=1 Tax=Microbispora hainanensis TaxID=568844 RepID=A0ABZ1SHJ5_9ACTN|nr:MULTISPECIES: DUF1918 domain-containing protein [Microbispora]
MKASVGDRLIVESIHRGKAGRIGIVVALYHTDGSPPYLVRWLDEERETPCFYPGPDARIEHHAERTPESP